MLQRYSIIVWWAAPVEIRGSFARLLRMGRLTSNQHVGAQVRLDRLRSQWREVAPNPQLRDQAERLLDRFPLKAADALQLAAALAWTSDCPRARALLSNDTQLLDAAAQLGFQGVRL
jgi:predicted nucleic acid-binding protein